MIVITITVAISVSSKLKVINWNNGSMYRPISIRELSMLVTLITKGTGHGCNISHDGDKICLLTFLMRTRYACTVFTFFNGTENLDQLKCDMYSFLRNTASCRAHLFPSNKNVRQITNSPFQWFSMVRHTNPNLMVQLDLTINERPLLEKCLKNLKPCKPT